MVNVIPFGHDCKLARDLAAILNILAGHSSHANSVAFSPDESRIVSGSRDNTIRLWDTGTGDAIGKLLEGHSRSLNSVAFSSDGFRPSGWVANSNAEKPFLFPS